MSLLPKILRTALAPRLRQIERFRRHPAEVQAEQLRYLLGKAAETEFGKAHGFAGIRSIEQFAAAVPVQDYDAAFGCIDRARFGEQDVIWPGEVRWFAKSSGTTGGRSKYIPVTKNGLKQSHIQGPADCIAFNIDRFPSTGVYGGKTLTLGGSHRIEREGEHALTGDLSAILIENAPFIANLRRVPKTSTALIADFEEKIERICEECVGEDVRSLAGVPSWNLVMLRRVLEYTGKANLLEVWPRLELFIHGGVNFSPYREIYERLIPTGGMHYMETYNASEGFFAISDDFSDDMLLMLDYGIFYEFLPLGELADPSRAIPLEGVRTGVNYAMIISSSNGLWRYLIGDTVEFTSLSPYRLRISGRTKHYINAFGEEIIVDNAERAIRAASDATGATVTEYTAAPIYMDIDKKGAHQWVVEFATPPADIEAFRGALDRGLQELNSDYEAKRYKNTTLYAPTVTPVPEGTFLRWMQSRGKTGGQNKVPRLSNDRTYIDQILTMVNENNS
ncbi:MAG: GH3 auxin-responsive promoter family protein [Rikenellaceae bacterium]|jgi:hypothetical protein|nr:GH3 auxin-responsive promoter family protein [Rikenellaceae bacterium]